MRCDRASSWSMIATVSDRVVTTVTPITAPADTTTDPALSCVASEGMDSRPGPRPANERLRPLARL